VLSIDIEGELGPIATAHACDDSLRIDRVIFTVVPGEKRRALVDKESFNADD
jgi:hypothetical protein